MRVSPTLLLLTVLIASPSGTLANAAESCDTGSSSQADLNECYGNAYKKSDGELNALYKQITARLKDDAATTKLLVAAQKAWVAFRDAECNFSTSGSAQGSIYPMTQAICLDGLTSRRIDDLKSYLKCEEGDLSCPVPAK
ncbi:lysozyme inhibitor LprI family protein [Phyllobacterium sp. LjRoot231]|uniref:lysozyme inhibitor LprI family protein n=1 Tax=Phyllobacterium sp. LjRoot231 TaxID=3342289 RepID=UPI003ECDAF8F